MVLTIRIMTTILEVILLQMGVVCAEDSIDDVKCRDQQETCECDSTKQICHFRLQIEELQTFASYIVKSNGEEETRGVAGDTYYFNNTGFVPALPPPKRDYVLEYGDCWNKTCVDFIIIHTGERYDFILNATQAPGNYMIRAQTLEVKDTNIDPNNFQFHDHTAEAVLHYNTTDDPDPKSLYASVRQDDRDCTQQNPCIAINCPVKEFPRGLYIECVQLNDLKALLPNKESELPQIPAAETKFLNFGFAGESFTSAINGQNFILPATPWQTYPGRFDNAFAYSEQPIQATAPPCTCGWPQSAPAIQGVCYHSTIN